MKCDFILTSEQQALLEQNMELVNRVISRHIRTSEGPSADRRSPI